MDAPQTAGDWSYTPASGGGTASFGPAGAPVLTMRCDRTSRSIEIARLGAAEPAQMRIRTEFGDQIVQAAPASASPQASVARIEANDRLLDRMAFSKGRFAVEMAGRPTLYIPAWPEVTRVIEDCR